MSTEGKIKLLKNHREIVADLIKKLEEGLGAELAFPLSHHLLEAYESSQALIDYIQLLRL